MAMVNSFARRGNDHHIHRCAKGDQHTFVLASCAEHDERDELRLERFDCIENCLMCASVKQMARGRDRELSRDALRARGHYRTWTRWMLPAALHDQRRTRSPSER